MANEDPPIVGTVMRVVKFITDMRKRDLLLVGFILMFVMLIGSLTGAIPSPLLTAVAQHIIIMQDNTDIKRTEQQLVRLGQLQLYLAQQNCLHSSKTPSELASCNRDDIQQAIIKNIFADSSPSSL